MLHVAALNHLWASNDVIRRARLTLSARSYQVRNFQGRRDYAKYLLA
jgi:hypothetical protein